MAEINVGEILEALNNKSDIDLNNLNGTGTEKFDGKWIAIPEDKMIISTATAIGVYEKDLSDILPNDGYEYDVLTLLDGYWSTGATCHAHITTSIFSNASLLNLNCNSATARGADTAGIPVGIDRTMTLHITNNAFEVLNLAIFGYRRIGNRG